MPYLHAHEVYDRLPNEYFELKWDWDPSLVFFFLLLVFYLRALGKFRRRPVATWQVGLFICGVSLNILALSPPIDPLADQLFWVHMVQHLMITHIGVPFMLFGVPFFVVIRGIPLFMRRYIYFPLLRSRVLSMLNKTIARPLPSLILFEVNYWLWHVPKFYNLALLNDFYHLIEHACFAVTAMLLWRNIIDPHPIRSPLPLPARLLFLGFIMALNVALSAYLTFSDEILYAYEGIPLPSWWEKWGHLQDQRLGGLIMWVPGGLVMLIATTAVFFVWARREKEKERLLIAKEKGMQQIVC